MRRARLRALELASDRTLNIETAVRDFGAGADPDADHTYYEPFSYAALDLLAARLELGARDVVYDLGCGKGRVVCVFARKAIAGAVGVDYDPALVETARRNAAALVGRRAPIRILEGDAGAQDYSQATVIFMYNPFGAATLRAVLERVTGPGQRVVYANPVHRHVFADFPALREIDRFRAPYDLGGMEVVTWRQGG